MRSALLVLSSGCVTALHVTAPATQTPEAPAFVLPAQDGRQIALADELSHGPVVLVFYRGFW